MEDAVPEVAYDDLKKILTHLEDLQARNPGKRIAASVNIWESVCSPGADIRAISYRLSLVNLLEKMLEARGLAAS